MGNEYTCRMPDFEQSQLECVIAQNWANVVQKRQIETEGVSKGKVHRSNEQAACPLIQWPAVAASASLRKLHVRKLLDLEGHGPFDSREIGKPPQTSLRRCCLLCSRKAPRDSC